MRFPTLLNYCNALQLHTHILVVIIPDPLSHEDTMHIMVSNVNIHVARRQTKQADKLVFVVPK